MFVSAEVQWRSRLRVWCVKIAPAAAFCLGSCSAYDPNLLQRTVEIRQEDGSTDAGEADSDTAATCRPSPSPTPSCPELCPEVCNGMDDDCDNHIDESDPHSPAVQCEAGCVKRTIAGHAYYFCAQPLSWQAARVKCLEALHADLARIVDGTQGQLLSDQLTARAWIGHRVLHDQLWAWADNGVPFWQGDAGGAPVFGRYVNWADGEPMPGASCGDLNEHGALGSADCSDEKAFVCELSPDACPKDADKIDPGQCGCGVADIDRDSDGLAACNDACDDDPQKPVPTPCGCSAGASDRDADGVGDCNDSCPDDKRKTAAGACGCGQSDADADRDGVADCNDDCPQDAEKQALGECGCGVADADRDGDGTLDCHDGCPGDPTTIAGCFNVAASNIDVRAIDFAGASNVTLNCGNTTVDTGTTPVNFTNWCGGAPAWTVQHQANGPDLIVIALRGLTVASNNTLKLIGSRPLAFAVRGNVGIAGTIDASANASVPGAGGNWSCGGSTGGTGQASSERGGGGGGGGFRTPGGTGGDGRDSAMGGGPGAARGNATLVPLLGGCAGGVAGGCSSKVGAGGGALQITASGTINVTGAIRVNGGAGAKGCDNGGGQGGGSGGGVLLESASTMASGNSLAANGGDGGDGDSLGGDRGSGSSSASAAGNPGDDGTSGGGGGGGYGRVVIH